MTQVFISYSRRDLAFVERMAKDLRSAGFDVWYDLSNLEVGKNWGREIQAALHDSQFLMVVLSPSSLESRWVEREYLFAERLNLKIIPFLYKPCELPLWTLDLHYIDMTTSNYRKSMAELLKVLGTPARQAAPKPPPAARPEPAQVETEPEPDVVIQPVQPVSDLLEPEPEKQVPQLEPKVAAVPQPQKPIPGIVEAPVRRPVKKTRWWYFAAGGAVLLFLFGMLITGQFGFYPFGIKTPAPPAGTSTIPAQVVGGATAKVTLWYPYETGSCEEVELLKAVDRASALGMDINAVQVLRGDIVNKYISDFTAGSGPDLCIDCADLLTDRVQKENLFADLSNLTSGKLDGYQEPALEALKVDGKLYGIPIYVDAMVMWYNQEKLPDSPKTIDELMSFMEGGTPVAVNYDCYDLYGFYSAFGGEILNEKMEIVADQNNTIPDAVDFFLKMYTLSNEKNWQSFDSLEELFFKDEVGAVLADSSKLQEYSGVSGVKLGVAPLPKGPAGEARPFLNVNAFYVNPNSPSISAAVEVALYLTNAESQAQMVKGCSSHLPVRTDAQVDEPLTKALMDVIWGRTSTLWTDSMANAYWNHFCDYSDVFTGKVDAGSWVKEASASARQERQAGSGTAQQTTEKPSFPVGATWTSPKDNAKMVYVPAGEFIMGGGNQPQFKAYLDGYWIDQTEVTIDQYEQCIAVSVCEGPTNNRAGQGNYEDVKNLPESNVTWKMAEQYCKWIGERLPTEAEWEKAARGTDGRTYPWGEGIDASRANYDNQIGDIVKVGSYEAGKSPYGAYDMSGNVFEWVADWYWDYPTDGSTLTNPTGPETGNIRILRGGTYFDRDDLLAVTERKMVGEDETQGDVGFRCIMSEQAQEDISSAQLKDIYQPSAGDFWTPSWVSPRDGMEIVYIPEGSFTMGSDHAGANNEPAHQVSLTAYWIDSTEVTNAMYAQCVADNGCDEPKEPTSLTREEYFKDPEYSDYPVVWVDWTMAEAYCEWAGRRLPTEAEWEKAARGTDERLFPWGNDYDTGRGNFDRIVGDTTAVGSYENGRSFYGAYDLAGNVWEWVADFFDSTYYSISPAVDPQGPASGTENIMRGGCFEDDRMWTTLISRMPNKFLWSEWSTGFRCAVTDPEAGK